MMQTLNNNVDDCNTNDYEIQIKLYVNLQNKMLKDYFDDINMNIFLNTIC